MNDIRGRADDSLTTEYAWNVGKAFAEWLPEEGVVVMARSVNANETTAHAVVEGVLLQGRNVVDAGQADQLTVVSAIGDQKAAGGIVVSHDDLQGLEVIELFNAQGVSITAETGLTEIGQLVEAGNFVPAAEKGEITIVA